MPRTPPAHAEPQPAGVRGTVEPVTLTALLTSLVWLWPVVGPVVTPFQEPAHAFGPGHRGVDIEAEEGSSIRAAHDGAIAFAGLVAGVPTVTIRIGPIATSYQPVHSSRAVGAVVRAGDVIGRLGARHGTCTCLHLGVRVEGRYRDPLQFLQPRLVIKSPRAP
ncbi:MAG: M23 family metallopeptidase [Actinobacteria bacterium]|nr:M23 family metallopeptidase [Actinomycetota bacterium]